MLYLVFSNTYHDHGSRAFNDYNWWHLPVDILLRTTGENNHTWYSVFRVRKSFQPAFEEDLKNQGFKEAPHLIATLDDPPKHPFKLFSTI